MKLKFGPLAAAALLMAFVMGPSAMADVKRAAYPEVKVEIAEAYQPDAAFEKMRQALIGAAAKHDEAALFELVGPTFVWMKGPTLSEQFDLGRDPLHNFKVLFGFRNLGADKDGGVDSGPFWQSVSQFAADAAFYRTSDDGNLVCGPLSAELSDADVFEQAVKRIAAEDADWVFPMTEVSLTRSPSDPSPVAKLKGAAVPVLATFPPAAQTGETLATHYEVLLATGRTGWIKVDQVLPLVSARLCYARNANGEWKIALFDDVEE